MDLIVWEIHGLEFTELLLHPFYLPIQTDFGLLIVLVSILINTNDMLHIHRANAGLAPAKFIVLCACLVLIQFG